MHEHAAISCDTRRMMMIHHRVTSSSFQRAAAENISKNVITVFGHIEYCKYKGMNNNIHSMLPP
jgi:hypothetical protein